MTAHTKGPCICGHDESMHYAVGGSCMKVITRDSRLEHHLRCTCKQFRAEAAIAQAEGRT